MLFCTRFTKIIHRQQPSERELDQSSFRVPGFDFSAGKDFLVTIFKTLDKNGNGQALITKGTLRLGTSVYADDFEINKDGGTHTEEKKEPEHHYFDGISRGPIESIPALADEYSVTGGNIESSNRRRGRVMKGWMDQLGRALTEERRETSPASFVDKNIPMAKL